VIVRNSRTPESFAGDLDSEVAACQMAAGACGGCSSANGTETVEACFERAGAAVRDSFRARSCPASGRHVRVRRTYIEHDGVDRACTWLPDDH